MRKVILPSFFLKNLMFFLVININTIALADNKSEICDKYFQILLSEDGFKEEHIPFLNSMTNNFEASLEDAHKKCYKQLERRKEGKKLIRSMSSKGYMKKRDTFWNDVNKFTRSTRSDLEKSFSDLLSLKRDNKKVNCQKLTTLKFESELQKHLDFYTPEKVSLEIDKINQYYANETKAMNKELENDIARRTQQQKDNELSLERTYSKAKSFMRTQSKILKNCDLYNSFKDYDVVNLFGNRQLVDYKFLLLCQEWNSPKIDKSFFSKNYDVTFQIKRRNQIQKLDFSLTVEDDVIYLKNAANSVTNETYRNPAAKIQELINYSQGYISTSANYSNLFFSSVKRSNNLSEWANSLEVGYKNRLKDLENDAIYSEELKERKKQKTLKTLAEYEASRKKEIDNLETGKVFNRSGIEEKIAASKAKSELYEKELQSSQDYFITRFKAPLYRCNDYWKYDSNKPYFCKKLEVPEVRNGKLVLDKEIFGVDPVGYLEEVDKNNNNCFRILN